MLQCNHRAGGGRLSHIAAAAREIALSAASAAAVPPTACVTSSQVFLIGTLVADPPQQLEASQACRRVTVRQRRGASPGRAASDAGCIIDRRRRTRLGPGHAGPQQAQEQIKTRNDEEPNMSRADKNQRNAVSRRTVLKGVAAAGGLAAGSSSLGGFPTIWAQNIKDVVLRHAGPPVTAIPRIAEQATQGPGLHRADAGVRERRPAQPLSVAVQRHRLRRHQPRLYALPDRPRRSAGDPAGEVQVLGQDAAALHQG